MAVSTCPKSGCDSHSFEVKVAIPAGANFKQVFIQCAQCGAVVGVAPYTHIGTEIEDLKNMLAQIQSSLD